MKKLILISALLFSFNGFADEISPTCLDQKMEEKPFIDNWETICPEDWDPLPSNTKDKGTYFAFRSLIRGPEKFTKETKPKDIEFAQLWTYEYDEEGLFGYKDFKAAHTRWWAECHKERFTVMEIHTFSDIAAINKIDVDIQKSPEWLPINHPSVAWYVLYMCNYMDRIEKGLIDE